MKGVKSVFGFIFFIVCVYIVFFCYHLLNRLLIFHEIAFVPLSQISVVFYVCLFLGCLFCSVDLFVFSFANTTLSFIYLFFLQKDS